MEYDATKLYQVGKYVEVSNMFSLWKHKLLMITQLKLCKILKNDQSLVNPGSSEGLHSKDRHHVLIVRIIEIVSVNHH